MAYGMKIDLLFTIRTNTTSNNGYSIYITTSLIADLLYTNIIIYIFYY
jgi:hypothetical protein